MHSDLLSRRFLFCLFLVAVCSILVWFEKIHDQVYSAIMITTVTAFVIGNTATGIKRIVASK